MGQGLGAVFPIVVVGVVANLLVQFLLHLEVVLAAARTNRLISSWGWLASRWGNRLGGHGGTNAAPIVEQSALV